MPRAAVGLTLLLAAAWGCQPRGESAAASAPPPAPAPAPPKGGNLLKNSDFESGKQLPWMTSFTNPAQGEANIKSGALCVKIDSAGVNPWDAQFRHREMVIQKGHDYSVYFKAWATKPTKVRPKVGMSGPPYAEYWSGTLELGTAPQTFEGQFTMDRDDDPTAELAFHAGGQLAQAAPVEICVDDVYLTDPEFTPVAPPPPEPLPTVRVNQLGYFPGASKIAVYVTSSKAPVDFKLVAADGSEVLKGKTKPFGMDADSGDFVHHVDFSAAQKPGKGYMLVVGTAEEKSPPFAIGDDILKQLKYDALKYFYHNRSGIEIKAEHVGSAKWARPAGHLSDKAVPCAPDANCKHTLDVSGGWYDAGDHGKYVVNAGISVWTMLNQYERLRNFGTSLGDFGDKKLNIPESGNKVNDLLDEARWEVEWMLKMQVPAEVDAKLAGLVHHKMHDQEWTALGMIPPTQTEIPRFLRPVSTAATLNLAAAAAQASRLFKNVDRAFSKRCLKAAETAYEAAQKNPKLFAKPEDTVGGGPYDDANVDDEFYWAAAELFATTKKAKYKKDLEASPYFKKMSTDEGGLATAMTWGMTDALGTISLAMVKGALPQAQQKAMRDQIIAAADKYLAIEEKQGYRVPFQSKDGKYPWGSNSFVINNAFIMGLAYDFTKDEKYVQGALSAVNYLLGTNAMSQSYVTGHGSKPLENPHHRFWSKQANPKFPSAPPGALSGGPNSSLQDPYAKAAGLPGCKPQKCFVDHIEAWSTNEITINWNAPLAWVTAFLDETGPKLKGVAGPAARKKTTAK